MNKDSVLENNSQIWATIGKIGAFLSVIIALITIYSQLYPDKAEINATCNVVDVLLPPSVLIDLLSEKDKKNLKQIEKGKKPNETNKQKNDSIEDLDYPLRYLRSGIPQTALQCEVTNKGSQEAKEVVLDLPFKPTFATTNDKPIANNESSEKSITIGTIRPKAKAKIIAWFNAYLIYDATKESGYVISYSGGTGSLQIMKPTYGWIATIARVLEFLTNNPLLIFTVLMLVFMPSIFSALDKKSLQMKKKKINAIENEKVN